MNLFKINFGRLDEEKEIWKKQKYSIIYNLLDGTQITKEKKASFVFRDGEWKYHARTAFGIHDSRPIYENQNYFKADKLDRALKYNLRTNGTIYPPSSIQSAEFEWLEIEIPD